MKLRKIAVLAVLAICAVVLAGSASAFDLDFLSGSDSEPQEITVGGIDFNIPAGFTENETYTIDNETSDDDYYVSTAGYEDDSKDNAIYIYIGEYKDYNMTDDVLAYVMDSYDYEKKTINGHSGYLLKDNSTSSESLMDVDESIYMFSYVQDAKMVIIGATDESYFSDIIVE